VIIKIIIINYKIYPITIVRFFQEIRCTSAVRLGTAQLGEDAGVEETTLERVPIK